MSWVRIHDAAMSHPKIVGLIDWSNPFCLWVWGLSYAQLHLTNGVIPQAALPNVRATRTASKLVAAGLWEPDGAVYRIHDFTDWNSSKEYVERKRSEARERMASHRSRKFARSSREQSHIGVRTDLNTKDLLQDQKPRSDQDPETEKEHEKKPSSSAENLALFDRFWASYPRKTGKKAALSAWSKLRPSERLTELMCSALSWQVTQEQWVRDGGQYIPHPATWLNQGRWDDEPCARTSLLSDTTLHNVAASEEAGRIIEQLDAARRAGGRNGAR